MVQAGFAHTPTGALLALSQIGIRYLITPGDGWRQVVQEQVLPSPGRDFYTKERATVTDVAGTQYAQLAAFKFVTYTPDIAVIQLVSVSPSGAYTVATGTVQWSGGDWKLQLQPDGGMSPTQQDVSSTVGFIAFSGVS